MRAGERPLEMEAERSGRYIWKTRCTRDYRKAFITGRDIWDGSPSCPKRKPTVPTSSSKTASKTIAKNLFWDMWLSWWVDFCKIYPTKKEQQNVETIQSSLVWRMRVFIMVTYRNLGELGQCHHWKAHQSKSGDPQTRVTMYAVQLAGSYSNSLLSICNFF